MAHDQNIDPAELNKFESLADLWWDTGGVLKSLHDINPLRVNYINQRVSLAGKQVLDVGCGGGILSEALAVCGAGVTGIDMSEAPLRVAREHSRLSGLQIDYQRATAESFAAAQPEGFDVVTCLELLEHVPKPASVVKACSRLVKSRGDVFFATINRNPKSYLFAIIGAEYLLGLVRQGTHTYRKFIKPYELQTWASQSELSLQDLTGMHYNPFLCRYSLGGNVHVNYLVHFKK